MSAEKPIETEKMAKIVPHIENEYSPLKKVLVNQTPLIVTRFTDLKVNPIQAKSLENEQRKGSVEVPGAAQQHANLLQTLQENGVELVFSRVKPIKEGHTPMFTRDIGIIMDNKTVPSRLRYDYRSVEVQGLLDVISPESVVNSTYDYMVEGGDIAFLEKDLVLVGIGPRTDENGFKLLSETFPEKEFIPVFPVVKEKAFHLDTVMGILGKKHLVYTPDLVPAELVRFLKERDYTFVETSSEEYNTCCTNVLAISNRRIIAPAENKITNERIRKSGVEIIEVPLSEILPQGGGPHCLTMPLVRE